MLLLRKKIEECLRCEKGLAFIELIIGISVLFILCLGAIEVPRCFLIIQKVENVVSEVADVTTQTNPSSNPLTNTQMSQVMSAVTDMMAPYTSGPSDSNILIIISNVSKTGNKQPVVNWQYCGGGTLGANSHVGHTGGAASIPNNLQMSAGDEIVIGEIFYNYYPIVAHNNFIGAFQVYRTSIYTPRYGSLAIFVSNTCT